MDSGDLGPNPIQCLLLAQSVRRSAELGLPLHPTHSITSQIFYHKMHFDFLMNCSVHFRRRK